MDLATIKVDERKLAAQLAQYSGLHDSASCAVRKGLTALEAGKAVVDLRTVFTEAMYEQDGQAHDGDFQRATGSRSPARKPREVPSVAIAPVSRARRRLTLTVRGNGHLRFRSGLWRLTVPQTVTPTLRSRVVSRWVEQVPITPPYVQPMPGDLVLWEASWKPVPRREFDPAVLEHIGGWLYLVREVWELSEVERAVLT